MIGEECLLMGDMNAAVNPDTKIFTASRKFILDWESLGKVKIVNDKIKPTRVPSQATHQANCLDLAITTPGLYETGIKFTLDEKREWTPAQVASTGIRESNGDTIFKQQFLTIWQLRLK